MAPSSKCRLILPYVQDFLTVDDETGEIITHQDRLGENCLRIQRWADRLFENQCCCNGGTPKPKKCRLKLPYPTNPSLKQMAENFKAIERWAELWRQGECCECNAEEPPL